jgi:hypothetical protein
VKITYNDSATPDAYQVDPVQSATTSAIYFPASAEGRSVSVQIFDQNGTLLYQSPNTVITLIPEREEEAIPIETSVNESGLAACLDPFSYVNLNPAGSPVTRRPPLVYLLWTSTRSGNPDLYFESIAPRWAPRVVKQ